MTGRGGLLRQTSALFVILAVGVASVLFSVKYQVRDLEDELDALDREIAAERRALHVLEAEWSHLTDPERLRRLTHQHLELGPLEPSQVGGNEILKAISETAEPGKAPGPGPIMITPESSMAGRSDP